MIHEIQCSRTDCDFHYMSGCSYGGSAVQISDAGCLTYELAIGEQAEEGSGLSKEITNAGASTEAAMPVQTQSCGHDPGSDMQVKQEGC